MIETLEDRITRAYNQRNDAGFGSCVKEVKELEEIMHWTQAAVTALAVGDLCSGSKLHHKLRDILIEYRAKFVYVGDD